MNNNNTFLPHPLKKSNPFKLGFTLSEVLITLVIIGVIAAITVPHINTNMRKEQYRSSLFKMFSTINQANLKYYDIYGVNPQCGYWLKNPYSADGKRAVCVARNEKGMCTKWQYDDGSDLPSDYNGPMADCSSLWKSYYQTLNVQKICKTNAYDNGCIPKYEGRDTIYSKQNPDLSDYDVKVALTGNGFSQSGILSGSAIVLADGTIIFPNERESARLYAIDVNGHKGPNKWGTDVYVVKPVMENALGVPILTLDNSFSMLEQGGINATDVMYKQ